MGTGTVVAGETTPIIPASDMGATRMVTARAAGAEMQDEIRAFLNPLRLPERETPAQGTWGDEAYLRLTDAVNRLVELTDGVVEILPMPTEEHQDILAFLFDAFRAHVERTDGKVYFAPLRLRIRPGKFREPDLLLVQNARDPRRGSRFWRGADLVAEVVSPDGASRDLVDKRLDYAEAGIPEYWIVDPRAERVMVLVLADGIYAQAGIYPRGAVAASRLLPGFDVVVDELFDAANTE